MEKSESVQLDMFIDQAKQYLLNSFKKETSTGDLTRIYPIEVHSYSNEKYEYSFDVKPLTSWL